MCFGHRRAVVLTLPQRDEEASVDAHHSHSHRHLSFGAATGTIDLVRTSRLRPASEPPTEGHARGLVTQSDRGGVHWVESESSAGVSKSPVPSQPSTVRSRPKNKVRIEDNPRRGPCEGGCCMRLRLRAHGNVRAKCWRSERLTANERGERRVTGRRQGGGNERSESGCHGTVRDQVPPASIGSCAWFVRAWALGPNPLDRRRCFAPGSS